MKQELAMRDLAATVFVYALKWARNPSTFNASCLQGSVQAWDSFCKTAGMEFDGLPLAIIAEELRPMVS